MQSLMEPQDSSKLRESTPRHRGPSSPYPPEVGVSMLRQAAVPGLPRKRRPFSLPLRRYARIARERAVFEQQPVTPPNIVGRRNWEAQMVGGDGFEPPTLSV